jgi:hypothetical protein
VLPLLFGTATISAARTPAQLADLVVRVVDAYTMAFTLKEDGKLTSEGTTTVSKDGKVLTVTTRRAGSSGPGGVEVYDRVQ